METGHFNQVGPNQWEAKGFQTLQLNPISAKSAEVEPKGENVPEIDRRSVSTDSLSPVSNSSDDEADERTTENKADEQPPPIVRRSVYDDRFRGERELLDRDYDTREGGESSVLEYVEVWQTTQVRHPKIRRMLRREKVHKLRSYMRILSPAVGEALRCVVDYFPGVPLSAKYIDMPYPFSIFVFYEQALNELRARLEKQNEGTDANVLDSNCANKFAYKHIGIAQDFVRDMIGPAVEAERVRHSKGRATFDMLWLLYQPGRDCYYDKSDQGEHQPYVMDTVEPIYVDGVLESFKVNLWNLNANGHQVGPCRSEYTITRFGGERDILSLRAYPCEYSDRLPNIGEDGVKAIRSHFTERGKNWYRLRQQPSCYQFDGFTDTFPRRTQSSIVIVDPSAYVKEEEPQWDENEVQNPNQPTLRDSVTNNFAPLRICECHRCEDLMYKYTVGSKFPDYDAINPVRQKTITDHQSFLCDSGVETFVFKLRSWERLNVSGFKDAVFDKTLFKRLVLNPSTKELIQNLTQSYIRSNNKQDLREQRHQVDIATLYTKPSEPPPPKAWSADFIKGKGEGLTFLLHGKPGVGKTYTAECIANYTERPLLSLTCSDIGVRPSEIESRLTKWFKLAEGWGAIVLIDEADLYLEQRNISDIERNHLVAAFLHALEYFKGILFLATNRVGIFDEAFISRVHIQIHYPEFSDDDRKAVWHAFFEKLQRDRDETIRVPPTTQDYVESEEVRKLKWNGREIRNAFQVAVALAEAEKDKDSQGRTLVKREHIQASVQMSREFKEYLEGLYKSNMSRRAEHMGMRWDNYGQRPSQSQNPGAADMV